MNELVYDLAPPLQCTFMKVGVLSSSSLPNPRCSEVPGASLLFVKWKHEGRVSVAQPSGTPWVPELFMKPVPLAYH